MKILNVSQMKNLVRCHPSGGVVFKTSDCDVLRVTNGLTGATHVVPFDGEIWTDDFNIENFREGLNDIDFYIYDDVDVLQMVQTLTKNLKIPLKPWNWGNDELQVVYTSKTGSNP